MDSVAWTASDRAGPDAARARIEKAVAGRYRVQELIGRGQFSSVFRATGIGHAGEMAIKLLDVDVSATPEFVQRLTADLSACTALHDEGVVAATSLEQHESRAFLLMPFMHGGSLAELLRVRGALPLDEVEQTVGEVAATLDRLHARGLAHGGLTPENILFDFSGRACITDVGVTDTLLAAGGIRGARAARARAYAAPEQRHGQKVDGRADQYALAVIAYEMLTGGQRLDRETVEGIHTVRPAEVMRDVPLRKDVPLHVNAALRRALSAGAANRFATTTQFAEALAGRGPDPVQGLPTSRAQIRLNRRRRVAAVTGVLVAILAIATIVDPTLRVTMSRAWRAVSGYAPRSPSRIEVSIDPSAPLAASPTAAQPSPRGGGGARAPGSTRPGGPPARSAASGPSSTGPGRPAATDPSGTTGSDPVRIRLGSPSSSATPIANAPGSPATVSAGKRAVRDVSNWLKAVFSGAWFRGSSFQAAYIHVAVDRGTALVTIDGVPRGTAPLTASVDAGHHTVAVHGSVDYEAPTGVNASLGDTVTVSFHGVAKK